MIRRLTYIVTLVVILFGCEKEKDKVLHYSYYDKNGQLLKQDAYLMNYKYQNGEGYLLTITGKWNYIKTKEYKEQLRVKVVDSIGLYFFCDGKYILTHRFDSVESERFCYNNPPFIQKESYWFGKKSYKLDDRIYEVVRFGQMSSSHTGNTSYYLKNVGFICYYFDSGSYLLCDKVNGASINQDVLKSINASLINDTTFFMKSIIKEDTIKYLPPTGLLH
jgi:hypothetical protein